MDPIAPSPRRSSFRSLVPSPHKTPVRTGGISKPRMYRHAAVSHEAAIAWNGALDMRTEDGEGYSGL